MPLLDEVASVLTQPFGYRLSPPRASTLQRPSASGLRNNDQSRIWPFHHLAWLRENSDQCFFFRFFTAAFAMRTADPSFPVLASTAFAVALHCFFAAPDFALRVCLVESDGCQGIAMPSYFESRFRFQHRLHGEVRR